MADRWRRHKAVVTTSAVVVVLVVHAALFFEIGRSDIGSALTFGGRVEGGLALLSAALVTAAASAAVVIHQRGTKTALQWAGPVMLVGTAVACLDDVVLALTDFAQDNARLGVGVAASGLCLLGLWVVWLARRAGASLPSPRSFALAATVPVVLSLANFVYTDVYQPSVQPRQAVLTTDVGSATAGGRTDEWTFPVHVDFKNTSAHKIYVVASSYSVVGHRVVAGTSTLSGSSVQADGPGERVYTGEGQSGRYELLQSGSFVPPGSSVETGGEVAATQVVTVHVPAAYDVVETFASIFIIRGDQATIATRRVENECESWTDRRCSGPAWVTGTCAAAPPFVRFQARIDEGSRLHRLVRQARNVTAWWVLAPPSDQDPSGPYLDAVIAPRGGEGSEPSEATYARLASEYGFQLAATPHTERSAVDMHLPITPAAAPPAPGVVKSSSFCGSGSNLAEGPGPVGAQPPPGPGGPPPPPGGPPPINRTEQLAFTGRNVTLLAVEGLALILDGCLMLAVSGLGDVVRRAARRSL